MRFVKPIAMVLGFSLVTGTVTFAADIDNMTIEELQEAYQQLEAENEELQEQIKDLKVQLYDVQNEKEEDNNEEDTTVEEEADEVSVLMTTEEFLKDIVNSYDGRSVVANQYTNAEKNIMTEDENVNYRSDCAEAERSFYEKYKNAVFEDLNIQYLCNQYTTGLEKQYQSAEIYKKNRNYDEYYNIYISGYYNRAYVIVELSEYYDAPFGDIRYMKEDTAYMDSMNEAETRNASVDHGLVRKTQELLNGIGFYCGSADGVSGKRTVKSIKRFQEMYGYEPNDGIIDEELIEQLQIVYNEKNPDEPIEEEEAS